MTSKLFKVTGFLSVVFFFSLVSVSHAAVGTIDKSKSGFKVHVTDAKWKKHRDDEQIVQLITDNPKLLFQIAFQAAPGPVVNENVLKIVAKSFLAKFSKIIDQSSKVGKINGREAGRFKIRGDYTPTGGRDSTQETIVIVNGKFAYLITMHADTKDWPTAEKELNKLMDQIKFLDIK